MFGNMIYGYRNSKRMAVNGMVKRLCKEDEVGYLDLWDSFVGKKKYTQEMACILVERVLQCLPMDCQGR